MPVHASRSGSITVPNVSQRYHGFRRSLDYDTRLIIFQPYLCLVDLDGYLGESKGLGVVESATDMSVDMSSLVWFPSGGEMDSSMLISTGSN